MIEAGVNQTKNWRKSQPWYINGKHNECENHQIEQIENIIGRKLRKTQARINLCTGKIDGECDNIFEWTENFDGIDRVDNIVVLFNLKMICGEGGFQTRSLREVYHFIQAQVKSLPLYRNTLYVNILDGDECNRRMKQLRVKEEDRIFVGSMSEWSMKIGNSS